MGYFFGTLLIPFWAAQFIYGFMIAGIAIGSYGVVYGAGNFLKNLFRAENVIESLGILVMSILVIMVVGTSWHRYEVKFFDCEISLASDSENLYSCRIRESSDGEWSETRSITKGSEPYMKYNRELYK